MKTTTDTKRDTNCSFGFSAKVTWQLSKKALYQSKILMPLELSGGYIIRFRAHRKKWVKAQIITERINKRDQSLEKSPIGNAERSCPTDIKTMSQLVSFIGKAKGHAAYFFLFLLLLVGTQTFYYS